MRLRLFSAISAILFLAACGSGDGSGTLPTLSPDASIVRPTSDAGGEAAAPAETQPIVVEPEQPAEEAPAAEAPATEAPAEAAPLTSVATADDGDGDTLWWPWVLVALVIIVVVVAFSRRRKPAAAPANSAPTRTTALLDDIDQLTSHLAALTPEGLKAVAVADATALATMRATLSDLIASAPDANTQAVLGTLTAPIAALHSAVDAVALSVAQSLQPNISTVAPLVTQLHTASASARAQLAVQH